MLSRTNVSADVDDVEHVGGLGGHAARDLDGPQGAQRPQRVLPHDVLDPPRHVVHLEDLQASGHKAGLCDSTRTCSPWSTGSRVQWRV